jgi:hypothetical protein
MGFVEGETGYCSDRSVTCDVDGSEEVSIQVEQTVAVKDEFIESLKFPPIKTEREVRLQVLCEMVPSHADRPFIVPKRE